MRNILFQKQFVEGLLAGTKKTTLRKGDAVIFCKRFPAGSQVSLRCWSGAPYRTPQVEFARAEIMGVSEVYLEIDTGVLKVAGSVLATDEAKQRFAEGDGFASFSSLLDWFRVNHGKNGTKFYGARLAFQNVLPVPRVLR